ncbi:MAG: glycosyltransferase family 4 protein [Prevotella sp.]|nr:glycosyltransferase family 4 protein [Prevotella sp.]
MKILYIHQYFNIPQGSGCTRSYWVAEQLIRRGHQVTMITAARGQKNARSEMVDGIHVVYVKNRYSNYMSPWRKVLSFLNFVRLATQAAMKEKGVDMVYATSTPLTVGAIALFLRRMRGWRYVFEVRDLWPEFPIQIGAVRNPVLISMLRWLERRIYQRAEHIVALSPGMKEGVVKAGTPAEKVSMIPNMSKPDEFWAREKNEEIARQFGIDITKFNVIHFGSMGPANGLSYMIEAAKCLKDRGDDTVRFIFMGSGATEPVIKKQAEQYGLKNVSFIGRQPMTVVSEVVNLCDASITTFLNLPVLQTNSPNKLFDSLSAEKPIIVNSAGWTKEMVEKNDCGFFADPEKPSDLADQLLRYKDDKKTLERWGKNARRLSVEVYDKDILTVQVAEVIEKASARLTTC